MHAPQPFRLFGSRQLDALRHEAARIVGAWAADWLSDGAAADVDVQAVGNGPAAGTWVSMETGRGAGFVARVPGVVEAAVFGDVAREQPSALAAEVGDAALADLLRRCLDAADGTPAGAQAPPAELARRGSGALCVRRQGRAGTIELWLDGGVSARWLALHPRPARAAAPLQPLRPALGSARVRIEASIGEAEIDIATLQTLAPGDVLLLDHRVDRPALLRVAGQAVAHGGHLGRVDGRRALQLAAATASPSLPVPRKSP